MLIGGVLVVAGCACCLGLLLVFCFVGFAFADWFWVVYVWSVGALVVV